MRQWVQIVDLQMRQWLQAKQSGSVFRGPKSPFLGFVSNILLQGWKQCRPVEPKLGTAQTELIDGLLLVLDTNNLEIRYDGA
jgi:hypothetical protein